MKLPDDVARAVEQLDALIATCDRFRAQAEEAKAQILGAYDPTTVVTADRLVPGDILLTAGRWCPVETTAVTEYGIAVTFTMEGTHGGHYPITATWNATDPVRVQTPRPTLEWWHAADTADLIQHAIEATS